MVKVKKIGRMQPRLSIEYFTDNPNKYNDLRRGKIVEIPISIAAKLDGIEIVKETKKTKKSYQSSEYQINKEE